jgi:lipopolysaccharide/colanic/teichoic acid biosynthesis glycosyltransferase
MVQRQLDSGKDYRNRVIAGLTGAAQVTKGEGTKYEDLDLQYIERAQSLGSWALVRYDLEILRRTFAVIARRQGLSY